MKDKIEKLQEFIDYQFDNEELLVQALTTPQFGNENNSVSYQTLEILGDSVIKLIFVLKIYNMGIKVPGEITRVKASLENDETFKKIAMDIGLEDFILKSEKQKIEGTRILADVFEAICGALFLDSNYNLKLVEEKIINRFYEDIKSILEDSTILNKNILIEFLQDKFKTNIFIKNDFEKRGLEHNPIWIAKTPKILDKYTQRELLILPNSLQSEEFGTKKDAEKDLYLKILDYIKEEKLE
ncbi:MAG: ribonuclease III domain-containing protein [Promethearchaeota archaeon]